MAQPALERHGAVRPEHRASRLVGITCELPPRRHFQATAPAPSWTAWKRWQSGALTVHADHAEFQSRTGDRLGIRDVTSVTQPSRAELRRQHDISWPVNTWITVSYSPSQASRTSRASTTGGSSVTTSVTPRCVAFWTHSSASPPRPHHLSDQLSVKDTAVARSRASIVAVSSWGSGSSDGVSDGELP